MKKVCWFLNLVFIVLIVSIAVAILYIILTTVLACAEKEIQEGTCMSLSLAILTLSLTILEYRRKNNADKTNLLLKYNERFVNEVGIQRVITYLQFFDENRGMESDDIRHTSIKEPEHTDFMLFARFFEELQIAIEKNEFDKKEVCRLFAYYAIEAYDECPNKIGDINGDESWKKFRDFCESMKKVEEKLNISHK